MRVLVCGGRHYTAEWNVFAALEALLGEHGHLVVIEGGCPRGADEAASVWAEAWKNHGVEHIQFKARWRDLGKAGPLRNQKMLDEGKPDLVLAFPGGMGTADMLRRARSAGVPIYRPGR